MNQVPEHIVISKTPVPLAAQRSLFFLGEGVSVPPEAQYCEALTRASIDESVLTPGGGQDRLFDEGLLVGKSVHSKANLDRLTEVYKRRALACADGSCAFAGKIATCYRRSVLPDMDPDRTPMDDLLEK